VGEEGKKSIKGREIAGSNQTDWGKEALDAYKKGENIAARRDAGEEVGRGEGGIKTAV